VSSAGAVGSDPAPLSTGAIVSISIGGAVGTIGISVLLICAMSVCGRKRTQGLVVDASLTGPEGDWGKGDVDGPSASSPAFLPPYQGAPSPYSGGLPSSVTR
jgi:hypothetical protein